MGFCLLEAPPRREKPRSVDPLRQCCQQFVVYHTSPCPQRCLMAHRRAVDLWSIHWCLCSRTDKPKLICRICRQRSLPAIRRLLDRLWLLTQDCDSAAVLTLRRWGCVATTPMACRGVSENCVPFLSRLSKKECTCVQRNLAAPHCAFYTTQPRSGEISSGFAT